MRIRSVLLGGWILALAGCTNPPPGTPAPEAQSLSSHADALGDGWAGAAPLAESRKYHAGVALASGQVLVTGGYNASGYLASATVYEPGTDKWTAVAPMPAPRQAHTATVLPSGQVLVTGGENASGKLASATVYAPATHTWSTAGSFASGLGRTELTATLLPSGKVLVAGGNNGAARVTVDVYDAQTGTWAPGPHLLTPRRAHTATLLPSGKVLVVGGTGSGSLATAEVYDPASNTWTATGSLTTARYNHTATLLASGQVLVVGGRNSTGAVGTAEVYEPGTGTWSAAGALGTAREQHTATRLSTGKVLVAGGLNGGALNSGELYDPAARTWSAAGTLMDARSGQVAVALDGPKKVLVVGGIGAGNQSVKTAELYTYDACVGVTCASAPGACYQAAGTCSLGVCSYAPKAAGATCDDGEGCTGDDRCNGAGVCAGSALQCDRAPGQCYEPAGTCAQGSCDYKYKAAGAACDDRDACTLNEVCNGVGGCGGTPVSCTTPPGQCYEAAGTCGAGGACGYAPKAAGVACNDGNANTVQDVCNGTGTCAGVVACTTPPDACHGSPGTYVNGVCSYPLKAAGTTCGAGQVCDAAGTCGNGCWIGGAYYAAGATNPSGDCQQCNPSVSTSGWSFKPATTQCRASGGVCDVAEFCTGSTATCPADAVAAAGASCRASVGACDVAEVCNGSSKTCPTDGYAANGTTCGTSSSGSWSACSGANYCSTSGTQSRSVTTYTCNAGSCGASTGSQSQTCALTPPSCSGGSVGSWSGCSYNECSSEGERSRQVTSYNLNCTTGQCAPSTTTQYESCHRPEPTGSCAPTSYGGWSTCSATNYCSTGYQSRSVTEYVCGGGRCNAYSGTETESCGRTLPYCQAPSYGAWSACSFADSCTSTGTQYRSVTNYVPDCWQGCVASTGTESQACYRAAQPVQCPGASYGAWGACQSTGTCGSGVQYRTVTSYSASGCQCEASTTTESQACSTSTSVSCPGTSYGSWSACQSADACGQGGQRSRTVTSYSASDCQCVASTTTETEWCSSGSYPYSYTDCAGRCVDTAWDNDNCGGCGNRCGGRGASCQNGYCCTTTGECQYMP